MSTSSCSTVNRRASSFARSSTSLTRRERRSVSSATISSETPRASSSSTSPSLSAATWPRIAVSGVRSSCDTDMRKFRSSCSASPSRRAITAKRFDSSDTSLPPRTLGTATS